jgi:hypothetical protein
MRRSDRRSNVPLLRRTVRREPTISSDGQRETTGRPRAGGFSWLVSLSLAAPMVLAAVWLCRTTSVARASLAADSGAVGDSSTVSGDLALGIQCPPGYLSRIYAQGLRSPDGLAFDPTGRLYVAEEIAGQVSRVDPDGNRTPVLSGLDSPEGITFDGAGNLYVVEDVRSGRLLRMDAHGRVTLLAADLEAPEGVAWGRDGALYITESSLQFYQRPEELRSRITRVSLSGTVTRIITDTPTLDGTRVAFHSYAGIAAGADGRLYVTNELAGVEITQGLALIPGGETVTLTPFSTEGVLSLDPNAGSPSLLARGLTAPEGLRFSLAGPFVPPGFPLYVAEEDAGGGQGRLSVVGPDGEQAVLCTGLGTIEDVAVDAQGRLYVSEDENGRIVQITPARMAPAVITVIGPTIAHIGQDATFTSAVRPLTTTLPVTYTWSATGREPREMHAGLRATTSLSWSMPGRQWITVTATNSQGTVTGTHALTAYTPPTADFEGTPTRGIAPLAVTFANRTSGDYTASLWRFGDGLTATVDSPTHTYRMAGVYTVTLTVSGPAGSDTGSKGSYITALKGLYLPLILQHRGNRFPMDSLLPTLELDRIQSPTSPIFIEIDRAEVLK